MGLRPVFEVDGPQLAISGKIFGDHKLKLENLASSLNIENRIIWLGYVPDDLLPNLYSEATAFIFPSLYEGFGLPILEAMRSGAVALGSNVGSIPEIGGNAIRYFNPNNFEDMVNKTGELLSDEEKLNKLRSAGYKRAKYFKWSKTAKNTVEVLQS